MSDKNLTLFEASVYKNRSKKTIKDEFYSLYCIYLYILFTQSIPYKRKLMNNKFFDNPNKQKSALQIIAHAEFNLVLSFLWQDSEWVN